MNSIGKRLKKLRLDRRLALSDIKGLTNGLVSSSQLSKYENDKVKEVNDYILAELAILYKSNFDYVKNGDKIKKTILGQLPLPPEDEPDYLSMCLSVIDTEHEKAKNEPPMHASDDIEEVRRAKEKLKKRYEKVKQILKAAMGFLDDLDSLNPNFNNVFR